MKTNKIDRLFQAKLEGFRPGPSPGAWQAIEKSIQKEKGQRRRKMLAVAASLLLLVGLGFYLMTGIGTGIRKVADTNKAVEGHDPEIAANTPALDLDDSFAKPETRNPSSSVQTHHRASRPTTGGKPVQTHGRASRPEMGNQEPATRNWQPATGNWQLVTLSPQ